MVRSLVKFLISRKVNMATSFISILLSIIALSVSLKYARDFSKYELSKNGTTISIATESPEELIEVGSVDTKDEINRVIYQGNDKKKLQDDSSDKTDENNKVAEKDSKANQNEKDKKDQISTKKSKSTLFNTPKDKKNNLKQKNIKTKIIKKKDQQTFSLQIASYNTKIAAEKALQKLSLNVRKRTNIITKVMSSEGKINTKYRLVMQFFSLNDAKNFASSNNIKNYLITTY
jgi:hypothetical protein